MYMWRQNRVLHLDEHLVSVIGSDSSDGQDTLRRDWTSSRGRHVSEKAAGSSSDGKVRGWNEPLWVRWQSESKPERKQGEKATDIYESLREYARQDAVWKACILSRSTYFKELKVARRGLIMLSQKLCRTATACKWQYRLKEAFWCGQPLGCRNCVWFYKESHRS